MTGSFNERFGMNVLSAHRCGMTHLHAGGCIRARRAIQHEGDTKNRSQED
jgi:hypothetical protein